MNESKSSRHQRNLRYRRAASLGAACAGLGIVAFTPASPALADWSEHVAAYAPDWMRAASALTVFVLAVLAGLLPVVLVVRAAVSGTGSVRRRQAPSSLHAVGMTADMQSLGVLLAAAFLGATAIQLSVVVAGPWWWLASGTVISAALLLAMHVAPAVVALAARATPIESTALADRLDALAHAAGVPVSRVDQVPVAEDDTTTAFVAGLGSNRRVFLASTVLREWRDDEILVVVAHELGHHRRGDLWRTLTVDALLLMAGLWTAGAVLPATLEPGTLAALPAIAWVAALVWVLSAPIRHAQSRHQEREADAFALALTNGAEAFSTVVRRLGSRHLADERPTRLARWLTYRYPTVGERLAAAAAHRAGVAGPGDGEASLSDLRQSVGRAARHGTARRS